MAITNRRLDEQRTVILDETAPFTRKHYRYVLSRIKKENKMKFRIQAEDLLRGVVVDEAGWYPVLVVSTEEKLSKSGDSTNSNIVLKMLGPEKYAGVTVYKTFSEKAPGMAAPFFVACGAKTDDKGKLIPGEFDFKACEGRKIQAYIKQRLYEGRPQNDIADFRPMQ